MKRGLPGGFPFFGFVWSQYAQNTRVNAAAKSFRQLACSISGARALRTTIKSAFPILELDAAQDATHNPQATRNFSTIKLHNKVSRPFRETTLP